MGSRSAERPTELDGWPSFRPIPVSATPKNAVYRFFTPIDRFVRLSSGPSRTWRPDPDLDRAGYIARLVEAHVVDYETEVAPLLDGLDAGEREEALEELYGLVCDLRPDLEIGAVRLPADPLETETSSRSQSASPERATRRLRKLAHDVEERLAERVVGQDDALALVAKLVRRAASGLPRRGPLARLLLAGPTGSGKTELARSLAEVLGKPFELIRVDCSELASEHEYSRLVGAPPGYIGFEQGGSLTERIRKTPDAVVLFDEVEKAHPNLHRLLLQVLDEARLEDGRGRTADFKRAFVLMTSNCGTRELERSRDGLGFGPKELAGDAEDAILRRALGVAFAPEFLARLDGVVGFRELSSAHMVRVAEMALSKLAVDVRKRGGRLSWTTGLARWLAAEAVEQRCGARAIETVLSKKIEPAVVDAILDTCAGPRPWLRLAIRSGRPSVRREAA